MRSKCLCLWLTHLTVECKQSSALHPPKQGTFPKSLTCTVVLQLTLLFTLRCYAIQFVSLYQIARRRIPEDSSIVCVLRQRDASRGFSTLGAAESCRCDLALTQTVLPSLTSVPPDGTSGSYPDEATRWHQWLISRRSHQMAPVAHIQTKPQ